MRSQRHDVRIACAGGYHHRYGITGHDSKENENDDRDAGERGERHKEAPEDRQRDHRFVTISQFAPQTRGAASGRLGCDDRMRAQVAGDTSVGCKAPDLFGVTLRSDL